MIDTAKWPTVEEAVKRIAIRIGDHSSTDVVEMNAADLIVAMRELGRLMAQNAELVAALESIWLQDDGGMGRIARAALKDKARERGMNEGELVYTEPRELAALRAQNAELVAALKDIKRYANDHDDEWVPERVDRALAAAGQPQGSGG